MILCVGRSTVYDLMRSHQLPSIKLGRARRIPVSELRAFVTSMSTEVSFT
ncbi:helix-turn-helix domain-containing protein [Naumannella sp. ID2617S]|nr:helix-turn-helix domain-containing protein [Naumannella sp. ID2617S]